MCRNKKEKGRVLKCFLLLLLCLPITPLWGQEYRLNGKLKIEGGGTYFYKLVFTDSAGIIKGYSISGHDALDEERCTIEGTLDRRTGIFEFKETQVNYLSLRYDGACRLYGSGRFRSERGLAWIVGRTWFVDPICTRKGSFRMNPDDVLNERLTGFNPSAPKLLKREQSSPVFLTDTLMVEETQQLTSTSPVQFSWHGAKLNLMLMDDKEEDGDQLSLILNGEALVREQELTKKEYIIEADLQPGLNKLVLHAENEGSLPPNTARIILWDDTQRYVVHSVINAGRDAIIEITVAD